MFNHLVESHSHREDFKRRGAFIFGTLIVYAALFVAGGVASIYAYNAHLDSQNLEIVTLLPPVELIQAQPAARNVQPRANPSADTSRQVSERTQFIPPVADSTLPPDKISALRSTVPEMPPGPVVLSDRNFTAEQSGPRTPASGEGIPGGLTTNNIDIKETAPPPLPAPTKPPETRKILVSGKLLNSQAISLPKPLYPPLARASGAQGTVSVQILIDETGRVVSSKAISGHLLLRQAAEQAASQARFTPTTLGDQPVKVSGTITFNFVLH
ncbi:MAG TPA: TonB family protein [Pyrinomonadaceae bacterium]|jgi:protein TonB